MDGWMDGWMDGCTVLLHCIIWDPLIYIHLSIHPSIHPPRRTLDVCYYLFVSSPYLFLIPDFPAGNIPMCNVPWGTYTKVLKYTPWRRRAPKARSVQDRRKERIPSRCQTYLRFLSLLITPRSCSLPRDKWINNYYLTWALADLTGWRISFVTRFDWALYLSLSSSSTVLVVLSWATRKVKLKVKAG